MPQGLPLLSVKLDTGRKQTLTCSLDWWATQSSHQSKNQTKPTADSQDNRQNRCHLAGLYTVKQKPSQARVPLIPESCDVSCCGAAWPTRGHSQRGPNHQVADTLIYNQTIPHLKQVVLSNPGCSVRQHIWSVKALWVCVQSRPSAAAGSHSAHKGCRLPA